jgi:hypothetical protein
LEWGRDVHEQVARSATDGEAGFVERVRVGLTGRPTAARAERRGDQAGGEGGGGWRMD